MDFTKAELQSIVAMCRHERMLMDFVEQMVPGVKVNQAQANIAAIASKADQIVQEIEKKESVEAKNSEKKQ